MSVSLSLKKIRRKDFVFIGPHTDKLANMKKIYTGATILNKSASA